MIEFSGLKDEQVLVNRKNGGSNALEIKDDSVFKEVLIGTVAEPIFIILVLTALLYFLLNEFREGFIMLVSLFAVVFISFYQDYRSRNAVLALKKLSATKAKTFRNNKLVLLPVDEIVIGDIVAVEEGEIIPADGKIISSNDFSVNESILTGESFPVNKQANGTDETYRGSMVSSGAATIEINAVGLKTLLGKMGLSLQSVKTPKTPLQLQIRSFVIYMVWFGVFAFAVIVLLSYRQTDNIVQSLLKGMTLAMSILPEEIPVALSTFYALGAFRLLKSNNIIVKQPQYVETLGSASVICVDKTGTITQNKMSIAAVYDATAKKSHEKVLPGQLLPSVIEYAMWSSEINPYDPMDIAIHDFYTQYAKSDKRKSYRQIHEYPLCGKPPMMTHIFSDGKNDFIIAAKGAPEAIINQSNLTDAEKNEILNHAGEFAKKGYRVLGVGKGIWHEKNWPVMQQEMQFEFLGLVAFYDPPKENMKETINAFRNAGISVKMITGDFPETAISIAKQINLSESDVFLTGQDVLTLDDETLKHKLKNTDIYARMFPEAKLKVINLLKESGEVVAMTGDGVNDGAALKAAHIGIAMGKRGSEVAKSASALILTNDNLSEMIAAVEMGRKIYDNLKKAIQYIVSIHIPIILIVTLPLILNWKFAGLFSPVHVIFLELIMGPTCSIIFENEPIEEGIMNRPPLKMNPGFLSVSQISTSIIQGLMITIGVLLLGYFYMNAEAEESKVRTVVFISLLLSNILLTFINRSFYHSMSKTLFYKNNLVWIIFFISVVFIFLFMKLSLLGQLFGLVPLSVSEFSHCLIAALVFTCWFEIYKFFIRMKYNKSHAQ